MVFISAGRTRTARTIWARWDWSRPITYIYRTADGGGEEHASGRIVSSLEGGYNLDALGRSVAHVRHWRGCDANLFDSGLDRTCGQLFAAVAAALSRTGGNRIPVAAGGSPRARGQLAEAVLGGAACSLPPPGVGTARRGGGQRYGGGRAPGTHADGGRSTAAPMTGAALATR